MSSKWKYSTVSQDAEVNPTAYTSSIVSCDIHTTRYPKENRRRQATSTFCHTFTPACAKGCCFTFWCLVGLLITGFIIYGGYLVILEAEPYEKTVDPIDANYYTLECICIHEHYEDFTKCVKCSTNDDSSECVSGYKCSTTYTYYYKWQIFDEETTDCNKWDNHTMFETEEVNVDNYNVNDTTKCWIGRDCKSGYIYIYDIPSIEVKDKGYIAGLLYFASVIVFLVACCCLCITAIYCNIFAESVSDECDNVDWYSCCHYWRGHDKSNYLKAEWNKLNQVQKCDYFINYYARKYQLHLGDDVHQILHNYIKQ